MPLQSDLTIDASKFGPADAETDAFNEKLIQIWKDGPRWYEVGAAQYRTLRWEGKTPLPKPIVLPEGINGTIPSRDAGRQIPFRRFKPAGGVSKGVHLHIHGGGWVLQSEAYQDPYLKYMADNFELTVFSVGYRLAPEDPWPAGVNDCYDAAEWLVEHATEAFGGPLMFTGGESAGGHLAALVALHLLTTKPPFYADMRGLKLPPALFVCGSEDPLLEDTVMMGAKWAMWGNESVVKVYRGAPHGFIAFERGSIGAVEEALGDTVRFVREHMAV